MSLIHVLHSLTRHRLPNLAASKFGSVLESDDIADDRTVVIAPIPLQHKYPLHPSNEADMQDALIAACSLHIVLQLTVIGPRVWIAFLSWVVFEEGWQIMLIG